MGRLVVAFLGVGPPWRFGWLMLSGLDISPFFGVALAEEVTTEDCTLSSGAETTCHRITVAGEPMT